MYIADTQNNRVRMIANGVVTTVAGTGMQGFSGDNGPATSAQLSTPVAVAVDPAGNLYIADINNFRIRKVSGGVITTVAGTAGYTPCGVAADSAGNVYVSDCVHSHLLKISNGNATTLAANGTGLAVDSAGNLYLANSGAILELSNGVVTTIGGGTGVAIRRRRQPLYRRRASRPRPQALEWNDRHIPHEPAPGFPGRPDQSGLFRQHLRRNQRCWPC